MKNLENRVIKLEGTISTLLQRIKDVNDSITSGFEKVDKNFEALNNDIKNIKEDIKAIRGSSTATLETVEVKLEDLTSEIKKINDVSSYEEIYSNMKIVGKL